MPTKKSTKPAQPKKSSQKSSLQKQKSSNTPSAELFSLKMKHALRELKEVHKLREKHAVLIARHLTKLNTSNNMPRTKTGVITSTKMQGTITIKVTEYLKDAKYGKETPCLKKVSRSYDHYDSNEGDDRHHRRDNSSIKNCLLESHP
jgi:ribosomal protein S17